MKNAYRISGIIAAIGSLIPRWIIYQRDRVLDARVTPENIANHDFDIVRAWLIFFIGVAVCAFFFRLANAHAYETQFSTDGVAWQNGITSSQARRIVIANLTPGTKYHVCVRAVGAGGSFGEWSDEQIHICT